MTDRSSIPRPRVLLVDNDPESQAAVGLMLASAGYEVSRARGGMEALLMHQRNPFDVVVTEILMPEKDGLETLMELRKQRTSAKFIATCRESRLPTELCLRLAEYLGAHEVLARPFQPEQLMAAVQKVLKQDPTH